MKTESEIIQEAYIGMKNNFSRAINSNYSKTKDTSKPNMTSSERLVFNSDDEHSKIDHANDMKDMFNVHTTFNKDFTLVYTDTRDKVEKAEEYHEKHIPNK